MGSNAPLLQRTSSSGLALNLRNSALSPPDFHAITPDEYLGYLRAAYRRDPRPFAELAREGRDRTLTLCSDVRPDLAEVLYKAIVLVAEHRGWSIAGGLVGEPPDVATARRSDRRANSADGARDRPSQ